jgi:4-diphosphocytidyl-2-C-methyl-D-erythritol kinase
VRSGVRVQLTKRIPVARGLGGGSSDAAAAMIGLLRLSGKKVSLAKLIEIAASLGADVPFFLFGGRALAVNRGDEIYPLPDGPKQSVVIVSPRDIAISTREAYRWASLELTKRAAPHKLWSFCALCWSPLGRVSNDFEAAVFSRHPRLARIRRGLLQRGAAEAALAGSGSAVFGIFQNPAQARRAALGFPRDQVFVVETLTRADYSKRLRWRVTSEEASFDGR